MANHLVRILLTLAGLLLAANGARPQSAQRDAEMVAAIDALVAKQGISADGPGVAVLVRQPGQFLFMKGYGLANLKTRAPITPRTRFYMASLSKSLTATAVLLLYERRKLSLQDNVRLYIPELPIYGQGQVIRIQDLLYHVSGLPEYLELQNVPARHRGYWVNEDYVAELNRRRSSLPLRFAPGQKYEYNNTNYLLLALIVQRVARKSFGAFLRDEIFVPAGMRDAFVRENYEAFPPQTTQGVSDAIGYEKPKEGGAWKDSWAMPPFRKESLLTVGDGGVWCNLEDLARWIAAMRAGKILKPATQRLALAPSETEGGKRNDYGFGWTLYFNKAGKLIGYGHNGFWRGFRVNYYDYLVEDRTTVIVSNRGDFAPDRFWYPLEEVLEKHRPAK